MYPALLIFTLIWAGFLSRNWIQDLSYAASYNQEWDHLSHKWTNSRVNIIYSDGTNRIKWIKIYTNLDC
jgi:hypothetical protein